MTFLLVLGAGCTTALDPGEYARERGALELVVAFPCPGNQTRRLGELVGGDLKTDWTAVRQGDGSYRVTRRLGDRSESFRVDPQARHITPETPGARDAWARCHP